jgi:oligoendopeptidase F
VVDIASRFHFERAVIESRAETELTADDFVELMLDAQRQTYGDGLDPERLHGYMWAAKPHYYGSDFYNFPYMFGMLFGLGLYAEYETHPEGFVERYNKLLSRTGMADAATLAADFGIDLRSKAFWQASLAQIGRDVDRFCALAEK